MPEKESGYKRPEDLLKSVGIEHEGLSEEERSMQKLLIEEYRKDGRVLLDEIKAWREKKKEASLGDAVRALYKVFEEKEK